MHSNITCEFLKDLFYDFNSKKIDYVVLRNYENLPNDVGNDLDILINKNSEVEINFLLNQLIKKHNLFIKKKQIRYSYIGIYLGSLNNQKYQLQIDFYTSLVKGWIEYSNSMTILNNRIRYKMFFVPNPTHEIQAIVYKELFAYNSLRKKYETIILNLLPKLDEDDFYEVSNGLIYLYSSKKVFRKLTNNEKIQKIYIIPRIKNFLNFKKIFLWITYRIKDKLQLCL